MRKLIVTRRTLFRISEEFQHVVSSDVLLKPTALRVFGVISVPRLYVVTLDILLKHRGKKRFFMFYTYNVTMNVFLLLSFNKCYQIVSVLEKLISDNSSMPALYRIFVHEHINSSFLQPGSVLGYRIYPVINISLDRFLLFIELLWYNVHAHCGFGKEKRVCKILKSILSCVFENCYKRIFRIEWKHFS